MLDADMLDPRSCGFDASHSGTTACVALFAGSQLLVANTGANPAGANARLCYRRLPSRCCWCWCLVLR